MRRYLMYHVLFISSQNEDFKMMGKLVATSIIQGGPSLPIFLPAVYRYILTSKYSSDWMPGSKDFPDPLIKRLLQQVFLWLCLA